MFWQLGSKRRWEKLKYSSVATARTAKTVANGMRFGGKSFEKASLLCIESC